MRSFCFACLICFIEGLMLVGRLEDGIHCGEFRKFGSVWMRLELNWKDAFVGER